MSSSENKWGQPYSAEEIEADSARDVAQMLTSQDMARVIGIPGATLQKWCERGLISTLMVQHKGRTYRRYSVDDCWRAALMGSFYRQGFEPAISKRLAELVEEARFKALERAFILPGEPLNIYVAISLKDSKWVLVKPDTQAEEIMRKLGTDVYISVDIDAVRHEMNTVMLGAVRALRSKDGDAAEVEDT